jgi:hypothetical protein
LGIISFHPNKPHILFSSTELPGRIVILSTTEELFLIDTESLFSTARPNFPPLALSGLSFLRTPLHQSTDSQSTLASTSSHVLIAGISLSQEIILLFWDLQFSRLLASHSLSIPSTQSSSFTSNFFKGLKNVCGSNQTSVLSSLPPSLPVKEEQGESGCRIQIDFSVFRRTIYCSIYCNDFSRIRSVELVASHC